MAVLRKGVGTPEKPTDAVLERQGKGFSWSWTQCRPCFSAGINIYIPGRKPQEFLEINQPKRGPGAEGASRPISDRPLETLSRTSRSVLITFAGSNGVH